MVAGECYAGRRGRAKGGAPRGCGARRAHARPSSRTSRSGRTAWEFWSSFCADSADRRGGPAGAAEGDRVTSVREGPEAVWLRVGDVAAVLGVSANTVRRWTDVGRIAAHRSPGGHRRYLADDVLALLPQDEGDGTAHPGDFAELRRQTPGPALRPAGRAGPHVAARRRPARRAGRGGARPVRTHRRAALRRVPRRRRDGCGSPSPRTPASCDRAVEGSAWATRGVGARRGRPRRRRGHLRPRHGRRPQPPRPAGDAAARLPLARLGADGAARRARRRHRAQRRRRPRLLAPRRRARGPRADLRRGRRDPAHDGRARAPRQEPCASSSTSPARWRRRTTSSGSSCASRSGCSPPPTPTASTSGAPAAA